MKVIFLGTPKPAAEVLSAMISAGKEVAAVITAPDKPKGRGLEVSSSEVAKVAESRKIPLLKPARISDPLFISSIAEIKPDIAVVVAYGKILPKEFLLIPKLGCINLHASLLPKYRGASPIQAVLLNGDTGTGVTIFKLNEKMDEGDVIAQEKIMVRDDDNSGTLSVRLFEKGAQLLLNVLKDIENNKITITAQDHSKATYCKIIKKEDGKIDFNLSASHIRNMVKAFYPWPGAFCVFNGKTVKILKAEVMGDWVQGSKGPRVQGASAHGTVLELIKGEGFVLSTGKGELFVQEVQPENSKKMTADEFVRGYRLKIGDKLQ